MSLHKYLDEHVAATIRAYRELPKLVEEHFRAEQDLLSGGYGNRQLFELVQNGADEILRSGMPGRIVVKLTSERLYCANEGTSISSEGIDSLLMSYLSTKRQNEIGRFGLGFKSVLGICDSPEFFSHEISFRFNPETARKQIWQIVQSENIPKLRTAETINLNSFVAADPVLAELLTWATSVVRLELNRDVHESLLKDIQAFPAEFLAFSPHVTSLQIETEGNVRELLVSKANGLIRIVDCGVESSWRVFEASISRSEFSQLAIANMDARLREREAIPLLCCVTRVFPNEGRTSSGPFFRRIQKRLFRES